MPLHDVASGTLERLRVAVTGRNVARQCLDLFLRASHGKPDLLLRPSDVTVERVFLLLLLAPVETP